MPGPAPKPDAERLRRNAPTFGWVELPADGREGPIPDLPDPQPWMVEKGGWPVATRAAWKRLWEKPQATQWDQDGTTLHGWALLHASMAINGVTSAGLGELRSIEGLHGLSPKAMVQLRWRVTGDTGNATLATPRRNASSVDRQAQILRLVTGAVETKAPSRPKPPGRPKARKN